MLDVTNNDTTSRVDDNRISQIDEISTPGDIIDLHPLDKKTESFIETSRLIVSNITHLKDNRLAVITGPCSIHDSISALEIANKMVVLKEQFPHLYPIMRVYFEKPRTTVGWKGLINDPNLDDSCDIDKGLKIAREILLEINKMGIPTAVEFLDTINPQYFADLVHWAAIGARTIESQEHRKMASGLSMPVGFKNGTNGDIGVAIDAIQSSAGTHSFLSNTKDGKIARVTTTGNPDGHIILRGGNSGTNYDRVSVSQTMKRLEESGIDTGIIIDFSHANSGKDHRKQAIVSEDVTAQIAEGNRKIVGVMIEANINEGSQAHTPGIDDPRNLQYGVSITDKCVDWEDNLKMLGELNDAVSVRIKK